MRAPRRAIAAQARPTPFIVRRDAAPGIAARLLWFLSPGWWFGLYATVAGYALCATVLGLPLGLAILHRLPAIMTLRVGARRLMTPAQPLSWYPVPATLNRYRPRARDNL